MPPHQLHSSLARWCAGHPLDCVEPVPIPSKGGTFEAVVGSYTLAQNQDRIGGLYHVRCHAFNNSDASSRLESISFAPSPAVLDTRVVSFSDTDIVVVTACADGNLRCHDFPSLQLLWSFEHGKMITSLSAITCSNGVASMTFSDSAGRIALVQASRAGCQLIWSCNVSSPIHAAEAWTVDGADVTSLLISGGDDGYLCATDMRTTSTAWKKRAHNSVGVTAVVCPNKIPVGELWTGGYDDHVRLWDCRKMRAPLAEKHLGGGVWRLKFHPKNPAIILAACMYDGFKVLERKMDTDDSDSILKTTTEYRNHESIAYGAAWLTNEHGSFALTASFYDKSLQLWNPDPD